MTPILGIMASQISGHLVAPITGSMYHIASTTLSTASSTITFSSIPADYTHLQVRFMGKSSYTTGTVDTLRATFNSDSAGNYSYHFLRGNGSAASSDNDVSVTSLFLGNQANTGSGMTSIFGAGVLDILDYANTNKYKTIRTLCGYDSNGDGRVLLSSSNWRSSSAITSVSFTMANGNFTTDTSFALYGVK
jgi:hypothetical protein